MEIMAMLKVSLIVWGLFTASGEEWCGDMHKPCFSRDGVVPEHLIIAVPESASSHQTTAASDDGVELVYTEFTQ